MFVRAQHSGFDMARPLKNQNEIHIFSRKYLKE